MLNNDALYDIIIYMKLQKKPLHQQRHILDSRFKKWLLLAREPNPRKGWLRAIRESLGMTTRQLAARLGGDMSGIVRLEEREVKGTATLQSLDKAARAMGCHLVYAIVPENISNSSLEQILDDQAISVAKEISKSVGHSMRLEKQGVGPKETDAQIQNLAKELKENLDSKIWNKK
jgi:predicted DNA-binding mobile mystery protein A